MPTSFPGELLLITDGTTTVDLLNREGGFCVQAWMPAVAEAKGGGSWRDSPLAEGRTIAYRQLGNVIDSFQILVDGPTQDVVAREVKKLRDLLESAVKYWVSRQPEEFVWLVARAREETNARYATIIDYRTPSDADPYSDPFGKLTSSRAAFDPWTLTLEHDQWSENPPGTGTCVELSAQQDWIPYADWLTATALPVTDVNAMIEDAGASQYVFGGDTGQIWRSNAIGVWNNTVLAHANCLIYAMSVANSGMVYASGYDVGGVTGYTYSTGDNGATWNTYGAGTNRGTNTRASLFFAADEHLYLATGTTLAAPRPLLHTIPGSDAWVVATSSTQWAEVLCCAQFPSTSDAAPNRMVLSIYDTLGNGAIYISDDYWATEQKTLQLSGVRFISMFVNDLGFIIAGTDTDTIYSSSDGLTWELRANNVLGPVYGFARDSVEPEDVCCVAGGRVWHSGDEGMTWTFADIVNLGYPTLYSLTPSDRTDGTGLLAGCAGSIYHEGEIRELGSAATCDDSVFAVNKRGELNLSNILVYDIGTGYTDLMRQFAVMFPLALLPIGPLVGEACYFGIDTSMQAHGDPVFDNIVFDIDTPAYDLSLRWEYYNGGWTTLTAHDGTDAGGGPFTRSGVNNVSWVPPDDWTTVVVFGTTALWVRCYVYAASGGAAVIPTQQTSRPYTCIWPRVDIAADQVPGTIMALARHKLTMRSDEDGVQGDSPNLYANRVMMGLRSIERGGVDCSDFTAYLNCSDEQNPPGITCSLGSSVSFIDYLDHATGRVAYYYPMGTQSMAMRVRFELAGELARQFYGSYRVLARVVQANVDLGDMTLRLYVSSPFGSNGYWSGIKTIPATQSYNKLIDFGELVLPLARVLRPTEYPGPTHLEIHAACTSSTAITSQSLGYWMTNRIVAPYDTAIESSVNPTDLSHWLSAQLAYDGITAVGDSPALYFLDLILLPTDEWYGDFVDDVLSTSTALQQGYYLDLDSIQNPREKQRPLIINAATGAVMSVYASQSPGPTLLNPQKQQRMWHLFDKSNATGTADWDSSAHILVSARTERMARYLGMRGDR